MSKKIVFSFLFSFVFCLFLRAQGLSNLRYDTLLISTDTLHFSSSDMVSGSLNILQTDLNALDTSLYSVSTDYSYAVFDESLWNSAIIISYRAYPFQFQKRVFSNDFNLYKEYRDSLGYVINTSVFRSSKSNESFIDFGRLQYDGDFSRGVSFGNGQSLNLNSSFNLQLVGNLTNDIEIKAAITDNNIPIQPEGNTANLQDFDKIFVQLSYKKHFLKVGDFDIKSDKSYFMRFQKSLQGLSYWGEQKLTDDYTVNAQANVSISRGKYTLNELVAEEGNQGPYKLKGADGETFIIVLSGSERLYINGELMQRGANEDYTIDYNLGEIRFMPKRLITKDLRIKIEFEYSDNSYFRYLYHLGAGVSHKKWGFEASFFSEQDVKNQSVNQDLTDEKKIFLEQIGDSLDLAFYTGAVAASFTNDRVLYKKIDTVSNGNVYSIYVYTTDSTQDLYSLSYSYVGEGVGSYVPIQSVANGRVFAWQSPDLSGNKRGSYEPVILLVTPKMKQLLTSELYFKPTKTTRISAEFALSNQDLNTFSAVDNNDDLGVGVFANIEDTRLLKKDSTQFFQIKANYEFKQDKFLPLERYRNVEFQRDWNADILNKNFNEHLGFLEAKFLNTKKGFASYKVSFFNQDSIYTGLENMLQGAFAQDGYDLNAEIKWLASKSNVSTSNFWRPKLSFSKSFEKLNGWKLGFNGFGEINKIQELGSDSLANSSFLWQDYTVFITNADSAKSKYKLSYNFRTEHLPKDNNFDKAYLRAHTIAFDGNLLDFKNHNLSWNLTYRNLQQDTLLGVNDKLKHFYLARINYRFTALKGTFVGNTLYELGSGREQKIQYYYIEAPDGQGNYAWKDINENGVQELNEFYVSNFQNENRFLRLITNSLEFQAVNSTVFNQSLNINPKAIWFNKKGIRGFLARFSNITSIGLSKKIFADKSANIGLILNPISLGVNDSILVSNSNIIRNTLFFNRNSSLYSIDYTYTFNENVSLLTSGFEKRLYTTNVLKLRWNATQNITWTGQYLNGFKKNDSDFYYDRRYQFVINEFETNISTLLYKIIRIGVNYRYAFRSNPTEINGGQFAVVNEVGMEFKLTKPGNYSVLANFKYSSVAYNDDLFQNEQLQIDMLQSLQNGNNYVWSVSFDKTIAKNFQFSLVYDGRKTGLSQMIHTGRAQVRAIF